MKFKVGDWIKGINKSTNKFYIREVTKIDNDVFYHKLIKSNDPNAAKYRNFDFYPSLKCLMNYKLANHLKSPLYKALKGE